MDSCTWRNYWKRKDTPGCARSVPFCTFAWMQCRFRFLGPRRLCTPDIARHEQGRDMAPAPVLSSLRSQALGQSRECISPTPQHIHKGRRRPFSSSADRPASVTNKVVHHKPHSCPSPKYPEWPARGTAEHLLWSYPTFDTIRERTLLSLGGLRPGTLQEWTDPPSPIGSKKAIGLWRAFLNFFRENEGPGRHFLELTLGPPHLEEDENPGPLPNWRRAPILCRKFEHIKYRNKDV
ncbi:hypothetical protein HPB50_012370 [Hyalomma asiaticum]|uniref:Uncharacterized protein n=1 Tax=Hyalomma asiaticum TaxID=266040 RepID=A0ACB7TN23_HYAAI|nr:hypothetical protein HPB50_012370 [Hyalomma asiaticum]